MTENPRRQLLRRARYASAGLVAVAVTGTAALTVAAAHASEAAGDDSGGSTSGTGSRSSTTTSESDDDDSSRTGVTQPSTSDQASQPQAGTNAS